jgi:hypothetical protein
MSAGDSAKSRHLFNAVPRIWFPIAKSHPSWGNGSLRGGYFGGSRAFLREVPETSRLLAATYAVALFTLIAQGLSPRAMIEWEAQ